MRYQKEKKRIVIPDKELEGIPEDEVRQFMKKVLARHYASLKNVGSGWSFQISHEPALLEWIQNTSPSPPPNEQEEEKDDDKLVQTRNVIVETEPAPEKTDACTQTDETLVHVYTYDIHPSIKEFGLKWLKMV